MGWSLRLGRIGGVELRVHVTFFLLLLWIAVGYYVEGGPDAAIVGVTFEHPHLNAGFNYLDAKDQTSATETAIGARAWPREAQR